MTTTHHPLTLHDDDDTKVVQLHGEYSTAFGCSIDELKVVFYPSGYVELHRFKNEVGSELSRFMLSQEEANAFISACETFQAERALKKLAEEKRLQGIIEEAYKLLEGLPFEVVEHPETEEIAHYWKLRSELLNVDMIAHTAEQLKQRAERALHEHQRYLKSQAIHEEVAALKEACPAIKIRSATHAAPWHVTIESPDIYSEFARTPEELLDRVKAAKLTYERWQAEQDLQQ